MALLLELLTHPMTLAALVLLGGFAALEALFPARNLPRVRGWRAIGVVAVLVTSVTAGLVPALVNATLFEHRLLDGAALGHVGGALVGFLVFQVAFYGMHRALHASDTLFRWFHQTHHSAERLDVFGAFFFSPLDVVAHALLSSLVMTWVLGLTLPAVIAVSLAGMTLNFLAHANVRTPRWLGYVFQRPESHSVHHGRGEHHSNYASLPLIDLAFGTFENPADFRRESGYWDGASRRLGALLCGRRVADGPPRPRTTAAAPVVEPATHGAAN